MPRTIHILAAVLATLVIAAPVAQAQRSTDDSVRTSSLAGTTSPPPHGLRPSDLRDPKIAAALAQERYYASYGEPDPITPPIAADETPTGGGVDALPFVLAVSGALIVGLAAGGALHVLYVRRRHATGLAT